jgi:XTP/dITP diphosphohydrolase
MAPTVVLASRNSHKLAEMRRLLAPAGIDVQPLPDAVELPPEEGDSYETIALVKARAAAGALGRPAIADDSGIEAGALDGAPGVRSARFAGPRAGDADNLAKLMRLVPAGSELRFVCALAYVDPAGGIERVFTGECRGRLAEARRGAHGFGYDPAFLADEGPPGKTLAECSDAEKDAISHRGKAVRAFARWIGT